VRSGDGQCRHLGRIYAKLSIRSRTELTSLVVKDGRSEA
jgi:hypothetical protein